MNGNLDPSFGPFPPGVLPGVVATPFITSGMVGAPEYDGRAVVVQHDKKVVVAGSKDDGGGFALARYDTAGNLDPSFGGVGVVLTQFDGYTGHAYALLVQPDQKLIAAGFKKQTTGADFALARYASDGQLDPSFGNGGLVTTNFGGAGSVSIATAAALQQDGKIVVTGYTYPPGLSIPRFALARYHREGGLDPAFGAGGLVTTEFLPGHAAQANGVAIQPTGRIVVAGEAKFGSNYHMVVAAYDPVKGHLDPTFGVGGKTTIPMADSGARAIAVEHKTGTGIVVAGSRVVGGIGVMAVTRLNKDGHPDPTFFANGGVATVSFGTHAEGHAVAVLHDRKIIVAGQGSPPPMGAPPAFAMASFHPEGRLDTAFGVGGKVITPIGAINAPGWASAEGMTIQSDPPRLVLAGWVTWGGGDNQFAVARYV